MISCIIVEDEKSAQEVLTTYINRTPFLNCTNIFESGLDIPVEKLSSIQLLFLDIELPEINGISFLRTIKNPPKTIITTAYSNYAVNAFEEHAIDYLVKPFSYERFFKAVSRVKFQLQLESNVVDDEMLLYTNKTFYKLKIKDVLYIKAEVDYVNIITENKSLLILDSLRNWERKLTNFNFIRIHRSYIVNTDKISSFKTNEVTIYDKTLPVGKVYRENLFKAMNID